MKIGNVVKGSAAVLLIAAMTSCGSKSKRDYDLDNTDLIPVQTSDSKYGLMNKKGEIVLSDEWKSMPSTPVNGFFTVATDDGGVKLYKMKGSDKYDEIDYGKLSDAGVFDEGLIVVAPTGKPMAVLDKNGEEKFIIEVSGEKVKGTANRFTEGLLAVQVENDNLWGFIDKNGEVVIKPAYSEAWPFFNGKALVAKKEKSGDDTKTVYSVIDKKGEKVLDVKDKYDIVKMHPDYNGLIVGETVENNGKSSTRWALIDFNGEEKVKFPEKVTKIVDIDGKNIIYISDDNQYGAMNLKGEDVVKPKYEALAFDGSNFLAGKGDNREVKSYVIVNGKGEETDKKYETTKMARLGNHGYFMQEGKNVIFVGDDGKEKVKNNEVKDLEIPSYYYSTISTGVTSTEE